MKGVSFTLMGLLVLAVLTAACRHEAAKALLPLAKCHLTGHAAQVIDAMCGTLRVSEDRTAKTGRTIDLSVAVLKATGRKAAPDALFLLAGGPGQSAQEVYPQLADAFVRINLTHDIVLVDQRGTGHSNALTCADEERAAASVDQEEMAALATKCEGELGKRADLRQYTTAVAMDDLDDVRGALGYDTIDLYGASYGTRAALVYLKRHESHVRAVVIDGVAPPDWTLAALFGRDGQRTLDRVFARCAGDPSCDRAFPDLAGSLKKLLGTHDKPTSVTLSHPVTAAPLTVQVSRDSLASTIHALSYESETLALLPLLIHTAAVTGDLRPLAAQSLILSDAMKIDLGMHLAVVCNEDVPYFDVAKITADNEGSYLGAAPALRYIDACQAWPRANVTPEDRAPVSSDKPVLLLSGEIDPVTPPSNASLAARTLPHSLEVTVPGEGHGALQRSCTRRIVSDFVERASVAGLSTECLKDTRPTALFTSSAGPQP